MARIRTIKPEFPQSESMGRVGRESRLCFILLFTLADDSGRLRGNSRMLASLLYPYDDDAKKHIDSWLTELHQEGCIVRYEIEGDQYIQINKWLQHQKIDKPSPSKIPEFSRGFESIREEIKSSFTPAEKEAADQGMERKGVEGAIAQPDGVSTSVWADFKKHRRAKKSPITDTAIEGIKREADKAGWTLENALAESCARGWTGFKAEWVDKQAGQPQSYANVMAGAI